MILAVVLASLILVFLIAWFWVKRSSNQRTPRNKRQRRNVALELFGSAVCVLTFVKDRHTWSGGFLGAVGILLFVQAIYTLVKYATQVGTEPEYRPPGAPPPIE